MVLALIGGNSLTVTSMADFLEQKKQEIAARLKELKPAVDEYHRLEGALSALGGVAATAPAPRGRRGPPPGRGSGGGVAPPAPATRGRRGRPRGSGSGGGASTSGGTRARRRGRPRGTGTRAAQTLELVRAEPGITIPQLAERMGIKQNYLYRVLPGLERDGQVRKEGRGWHPKG